VGSWESQISRCQESVFAGALALLYRDVPTPLRDRLIQRVQEEAARGEIDLSGLWVAQTRGGRIEGVLLTQELAGRAAAVWAPVTRMRLGRSSLASALVRVVLADLQERGFALAQAVLDETTEPRTRRDLERGGMPWITDLLYLERNLKAELPPPAPLAFTWQSYTNELDSEFRTVLKASYTASLDMPELENARTLDEIMMGHRAAGSFSPDRWQLGRLPGEPDSAAVLLMTSIPERNLWEVIYLGLTPQARGRGLGRDVIRHAVELARGNAASLLLTVDARNLPAVQLYTSCGFQIRDRRSLHLAVFSR
jgi:mycothiol synthase